MIEILTQIKPDGSMVPETSEDQEILFSKYKVNQIVKNRVSGSEKERSIPEHNLYRACCKVVADNFDGISGDPYVLKYNTPEKVSWQCKIDLGFIEGYFVSNSATKSHVNCNKCGNKFLVEINNVQIIPKSLNFKKTKQAETHGFIKNAIHYMAVDVLGLESADELVKIAKSRMKRRGNYKK